MIKNTDSLIISDLKFTYPDSSWTLQVDEFHLETGEITVAIGPNGSGKSTLLRLAAGVLPFSIGRIGIMGQDIRTLDRRHIARYLGYMPQSAPYEFDPLASEVVSMGRYAYLTLGGFLRERDLRVMDDCMRQTETLSLKNRRLSHLSGGERQRVLLASVLAQEPSILILDEPTNALDIHHQIRFFEILTCLAVQGLAILVVTHDLNLASLFCGRIVLMNEGRIVRDGSPESVIEPDIISKIYGDELLLSKHPQTGRPMIFPSVKGKAI